MPFYSLEAVFYSFHFSCRSSQWLTHLLQSGCSEVTVSSSPNYKADPTAVFFIAFMTLLHTFRVSVNVLRMVKQTKQLQAVSNEQGPCGQIDHTVYLIQSGF